MSWPAASMCSAILRRRPLWSTPFPYTTLCRSGLVRGPALGWRLDRLSRARGHGGERRDGAAAQVVVHGEHRLEGGSARSRSEEHTSELQSLTKLVCRLLLQKNNRHDRPDRDAN